MSSIAVHPMLNWHNCITFQSALSLCSKSSVGKLKRVCESQWQRSVRRTIGDRCTLFCPAFSSFFFSWIFCRFVLYIILRYYILFAILEWLAMCTAIRKARVQALIRPIILVFLKISPKTRLDIQDPNLENLTLCIAGAKLLHSQKQQALSQAVRQSGSQSQAKRGLGIIKASVKWKNSNERRVKKPKKWAGKARG